MLLSAVAAAAEGRHDAMDLRGALCGAHAKRFDQIFGEDRGEFGRQILQISRRSSSHQSDIRCAILYAAAE
ncbi:hypothetical protein ACO2Q3_11680 [Caulobacter sp. KR2-114]|uniref:hypothetical protein n=1 Tax=Caulobacter sp. KR2-114 TaxID=3400912 RepID=UPI003C11B618